MYFAAPSGNRTQGNCLEGNYVTTTPMVLLVDEQSASNNKNLLQFPLTQPT